MINLFHEILFKTFFGIVYFIFSQLCCSRKSRTSDAGYARKRNLRYSSGKNKIWKLFHGNKLFGNARAKVSFGKYAEQAQAELIYAYYENGLFDASVAASERFISLHPRHPNTDYAYFMKGLAKFSKEKELLSSVPLLGELTYKRDLTRAKTSFEELTEFISRFPESNYVDDAKRRMFFLRNLIAKQEIEVAEFYIQRKAYIAAISRADYIIANLPNSKEVRRALEIKVQAYGLMGKDSLKKQASEVLQSFIDAAEKKETAKS